MLEDQCPYRTVPCKVASRKIGSIDGSDSLRNRAALGDDFFLQCSLCLWPQHAHQHQTSASQTLSGRMNHCIADLCTILEACNVQMYRTVVKRFTHSIVHQEYCTLPWRCTTARRKRNVRFGCSFHPPLIQKDEKLDLTTFSLSALMSLTIAKFYFSSVSMLLATHIDITAYLSISLLSVHATRYP